MESSSKACRWASDRHNRDMSQAATQAGRCLSGFIVMMMHLCSQLRIGCRCRRQTSRTTPRMLLLLLRQPSEPMMPLAKPHMTSSLLGPAAVWPC